MLGNMAKEEVVMLIGVSSKIDDLVVKLRDLKNVLADADRRNITDESVQGWVEELKRAMYDATDILDLCRLKVMEKGPSADMGCLNPLLFCMRNPFHAHEISNRIKTLNQKLDEISKRGGSFNFIKLEAYQNPITTHPSLVCRKTDPVLERSGVVGEKIEEDTRVLVEMLTKEKGDESDGISVVAIVGVGGIGKTTLSKKVFNDPFIEEKFAKRIWLSITQEFNEVELLKTAINAVDKKLLGSGGGSQDKGDLVPTLANAIRDKKLFLVLDDMWGLNAWTNLLKVPFSHGAPGSRVLITSRHEAVARGMRAVRPYYHVDKLGSEDAWSLLKEQILINEKSEQEIDMLKDIGLQIVEKCDGLPLAVKVLGGLLCQREIDRRDWEKVLNDSTWSVSRMPEELNYAIYLSYKDLNPCLKQCFLHFSLMPKNSKSKSKSVLDREELVAMWISEGFVYEDSDRLEELGSEYYRELIMRNLIEPDTEYEGQYVCNMHDVVRSFAQYVTRDEALVSHNGENIKSKLSSQRFLRLSIETIGVESEEFEWRSLQEQKSLRSIIFSGTLKIQSSDSLIIFSSLRTLHIEFTNFAPLVVSLHQLKHLRYLAVENCNDINSLPEDIDKLKFLQYISLEGCENLVKLPDNIVKLWELRYLNLLGTGVVSVPGGFCALTKLRALYGFPADAGDNWCNLEELGPLTNLRTIHLVGLGDVSTTALATKARLDSKGNLTGMFLDCGGRLVDDGLDKKVLNEKDQEIIEKVFDELHPPPSIEDINIAGYFGRHLPRWMLSAVTTSLNRLTNVKLVNLACCTQLPDGLCLLQFLEYLVVNHAPSIKHVGLEFVHPHSNRHHPSSQPAATFPRLHKMYLIEMMEWEEWEWEEEVHAMPVLKELFIESCKLQCIPSGLASHARALRKLSIGRIQRLQSLENFAFVVEINLFDLPDLTGISNFPKLQTLEIENCPKLESLQEMSALQSLTIKIQDSEKQLPLYLPTVKPNHLVLKCGDWLLTCMAEGKSGPNWDAFNHIQHVEVYAIDEDGENILYMSYTREPYKIETSIMAIMKDQSENGDEEYLEDVDEEDNHDDVEKDEQDNEEGEDEEDVDENAIKSEGEEEKIIS
ncbi:unnamed protein product [Alopecurus aequalis]